MSDLVSALRIIYSENGPSECGEAADEIERLRGENLALTNEVEVLRFAGDVQGERLTAAIEQVEMLLREARQRTQNLLHRQHGDAIIMNPDEYLRATLSWLDDALAESGHESGQNGPSAADQPEPQSESRDGS